MAHRLRDGEDLMGYLLAKGGETKLLADRVDNSAERMSDATRALRGTDRSRPTGTPQGPRRWSPPRSSSTSPPPGQDGAEPVS